MSLTKTFDTGPFTSPGEACFTLTRTSPTGAGTPPLSTDAAEQCDTGTSITLTWHSLVAGSYKISETKTPAGYSTLSDITFTVAAGDFSAGNLVQEFNRNDPLLQGSLKIAKTIAGSTSLGNNSFQFTVQKCGAGSTATNCVTPGAVITTVTVDDTHNPVTGRQPR